MERRGVVGDDTHADDLAAAVDRRGGAARAAEEGAEVDHSARCRPRKRMTMTISVGGVALADDLAAVVDRRGSAIRAAEGAEVDHSAGRRPRKRMATSAGGVALADDLAAGVDRPRRTGPAGGVAKGAAEAAEVDHSAYRRPQKRVGRAAAGDGLPTAGDLAAVVDRMGYAASAAKGVEIDRDEGSFCRVRASGVRGQEDREQDEHSTSRPRDPEAHSRDGLGSSVDHEEHEAGESLSRRSVAHETPPRYRWANKSVEDGWRGV